ncbi:hypothetical protein ACFRQM_49375, partial [Streptomyces sp. NPDC056831]
MTGPAQHKAGVREVELHYTDDIGVFLGLDINTAAQHGHGLTPAGKKVFDGRLPDSEPKLRTVFGTLTARFGTAPVIADREGHRLSRWSRGRCVRSAALLMRRTADDGGSGCVAA